MKLIYSILILSSFLAIGCGNLKYYPTKKDWADLERWDKNDNERLDLAEFVEGYNKAKFFSRWTEDSESIADSTFLSRTFSSLDRNKDTVLDSTEFTSRRVLWTFRGARDLRAWDANQDNIIQFDEFIQKAQSEKIALEFDLSADGQITNTEMAQGMFEVCDKNDDNSVKGLEFYLWEIYRR